MNFGYSGIFPGLGLISASSVQGYSQGVSEKNLGGQWSHWKCDKKAAVVSICLEREARTWHRSSLVKKPDFKAFTSSYLAKGLIDQFFNLECFMCFIRRKKPCRLHDFLLWLGLWLICAQKKWPLLCGQMLRPNEGLKQFAKYQPPNSGFSKRDLCRTIVSGERCNTTPEVGQSLSVWAKPSCLT